MLGTKDKLLLPAVVLALALSACALTKVINTWRDPDHRGTPKKVLVHAMAMSPTVKVLLENMLVERLKERGLDALASNKVLPESMTLDKAHVRPIHPEGLRSGKKRRPGRPLCDDDDLHEQWRSHGPAAYGGRPAGQWRADRLDD